MSLIRDVDVMTKKQSAAKHSPDFEWMSHAYHVPNREGLIQFRFMGSVLLTHRVEICDVTVLSLSFRHFRLLLTIHGKHNSVFNSVPSKSSGIL